MPRMLISIYGHISVLLLLALPALSWAPPFPCPILGGDYPAPSNLSSSSTIQSAASNLTNLLNTTILTGNSTHGSVQLNNTSVSISIFSTSDPVNNPFFEYHYTSPTLSNVTNGVKTVDSNSIYRIGSMSKLFTVYTFLAEVGDGHWNEPVTKYVPELAAAAKSQQDATVSVQWTDVTLGDLASQLSGIGRDYGQFDLALEPIPSPDQLVAGGLPPLNATEIPSCGVDPTCSRAGFFAGLIKRHPVYQPATTPIYSNAAYQILSYALEAMTNKTFESMLDDKIFTPLKMNSSSLSTPKSASSGVIPVNELMSGWNVSAGEEGPAGGMYMSLKDVTAAGISMLSSTLLPPAVTRRWMKPTAHTSNLVNAVGAPWEIFRDITGPNNRIVDYYTKSGDIGTYSSIIALSPDYNVGFAILAAQDQGSPAVSVIADLIADALLPALEDVAKEQATAAYVGTYTSQDGKNNSLTLATDDMPGMAITSWTSNGTDEMAGLSALLGLSQPILRLYPTNAQTSSSRAYRMIIQDAAQFMDTGVFSSACETWVTVDGTVYGAQGVDEFDFGIGSDGKAMSVTLPAYRQTLVKKN